MFLAIGAQVTLRRLSFPSPSRVRFLRVLLHVVKLVNHIRESVKRFAIGGEISGTGKLKQTTGNIDISKRALRL